MRTDHGRKHQKGAKNTVCGCILTSQENRLALQEQPRHTRCRPVNGKLPYLAHFPTIRITVWHPAVYIRQSAEPASTAVQKAAFSSAKHGLLQPQRPPFARPKTAFQGMKSGVSICE
jgi:hypothetical protein